VIKLKKTLTVLTLASILCLFAVPAFAISEPNAQDSLENLRKQTGYTTTDLPTFIGRIIKWVLGIIGVVMIAMFVYGGVMYATSAGNEDRIETGKKVMVYTIVGVIIIALAYVLTDFVIDALFPTT